MSFVVIVVVVVAVVVKESMRASGREKKYKCW